MVRARASRRLDVTRLAQAASRPGADTRTWVLHGRVVELGYGAEEGLIVVVSVLGGSLAGEEVVCELAPSLARAGALASLPIAIGDTAVCVVAEGEANIPPSVVGFLRMADAPAPSAVNGRAIDLALLAAAYVLADPARALELELGDTRLVAPTIKLGPTPDPTQPFVRGKAMAQALGAWLDAIGTFCTTAATASTAASAACVGPIAPLKAFFDSFTPALNSLKSASSTLKSRLVEGDVLSQRITGE